MATRANSGIRRRSPVVNGIYYPEGEVALTDLLSSWGLQKGFQARGGQIVVAPHGAWDLTGSIAASAFACLQRSPDGGGIGRVLLLGPCHQSGEDSIYLSESDFFETPLGDLEVDKGLNRKLSSCSTLISTNDIPHLSEHSLEVLLPMVKYCFPGTQIVPILMNSRKPLFISALAKALRISLETSMEECLIIISSTVSQNFDPAIAFAMANEFCSLLEGMEARAFLVGLAEGRISACGGALLGALFESGLLSGKRFSAMVPLAQGKGDDGETVYYRAYGA